MEHSNLSSNKSKANNNGKTSTQHVTPHHGASANTATSSNQNNASKPTNTYVTPGNRSSATSTKKKSTTSFDASLFAAVPAEQLNNNTTQKQKENANPQSKDGLALPRPRPGTSRGGASDNSPTSAYIANLSNGTTGTTTATPSMFGANGTLSQALAVEQSLAQTLKRKSESMDSSVAAAAANKSANHNSGAKNPYSQG